MNFVFINLLQRSANYISCANLTFNYILKIKFEWNTVLTIPVFFYDTVLYKCRVRSRNRVLAVECMVRRDRRVLLQRDFSEVVTGS